MSMYLEHFGLREAPFRITPHTEFFFSGGNRGATLDALIYAITHDEGIVKVTGEVGSGKTMLCRMLLERLPDRVETIYLANPSMTREEILFALADDLGLPDPPARMHLLLRTIQQRLVALFGEGKQIVMLIDEAHAMPAESLEEIRLLSNLETNRHKLLQIVLFGQPELDELLSRTEMRQLRERITHNFALEPLHRPDIGSYVGFRMRAAGYRGPDPFTAAAIQLIAESSAGLTRRINILADKALLAAYSENVHRIDAAQAKAAIRDAQFGAMPGRRPAPVGLRQQVIAGAIGVALAGAAGVTWRYLGDQPAAATPIAIPAQPAPSTGAATVASARPVPGAPTDARLSPAAKHGASRAPATPTAAAASLPINGQPLARRIQSVSDWLPGVGDDRYFIQLLRTHADSAREIDNFIERNGTGLDVDKLRIYRSSINGQDWLGVIYGDYGSREEALAAIGRLPDAVRANGPYPRTVKMLR